MKILHILALITVVYTSKGFENTMNATINQNSNNLSMTPLYMNDATTLEYKVNQITNSIMALNIESNPAISEDDEIDSILSSLFFSHFKRTISFFLYNISTLRPVFIAIHNIKKTEQNGFLLTASLLFKHAVAFKVKMLRALFEIENTADIFQRENIIQLFKVYLHVRNVQCENLTFKELKEKVMKTDSHFYFSSIEFDSSYNQIIRDIATFICNRFNFDQNLVLVLLSFVNLIHDLISKFGSTYRFSLNKDIYPILQNYRDLFCWAIEKVTNISNSGFLESLSRETYIPYPFHYSDVQLISGFVTGLFRVLQANKACKFFTSDVFSFSFHFLSKSIQDPSSRNDQVWSFQGAEKLAIIFMKFSNEIIQKRNELKKIEELNGDFFIFEKLNPIVNEFLKLIIKTVGNEFIVNAWPIRAGSKRWYGLFPQ